MRHLALAYPDDPRAAGSGRRVPVRAGPAGGAGAVAGARRRSVYLPHGGWVDLWRSARYRRATAGCRWAERACCAAGASVSLPAPLDELPLLARAGTLLPLLPPDVDTLAAYGDRAPAVSLHERQGQPRAAGVPARPSSARLEDGGSLVSRERRGRGRSRSAGSVVAPGRSQHRWQPWSARSSRARCARRAVASKAGCYDAARRVLHATFRARHATVVARGC